jgi:hypothetical protein
MTTREADKIISSQKPVTVHNSFYNETFTKIFVRRDRRIIYSADGGAFERSDLQIVKSDEK